MSSRVRAIFGMILCVFIWGSAFTISSFLLSRGLSSTSIAMLRFIVAVPLMFVIKKLKTPNERPEKSDYKIILLATIFGIILYFLFEYSGIRYVAPGVASIILSLAPAIALILQRVVFGIRFTPYSFLGIVLSFFGAVLVVGPSRNASGASGKEMLGIILLFLACISWVIYIYISQRLAGKYAPYSIVAWQFSIALLVFAPMGIRSLNTEILKDPKVIFSLLFLGLISSGVGFLLYMNGVAHLGAITSSVFQNFTPVATLIASRLLLGTKVAPVQIIGVVIVITGAIIVSSKDKKAELQKNN